MKFRAAAGYISVEPIISESVIASDDKKFVEKAKIIGTDTLVFFRPHGFFETEHEGQKYYVIRESEEIILGYFTNE